MIVGLILVAPFWAGVYMLGGWRAVVGVMLTLVALEIVLFLLDQRDARCRRQAVVDRFAELERFGRGGHI